MYAHIFKGNGNNQWKKPFATKGGLKNFTHQGLKHSLESDGQNSKGEHAYSIVAHYSAGDSIVGHAYHVAGKPPRVVLATSVLGTGLDGTVSKILAPNT